MAQCNESCEHKARSDKRLAFLADRMARLMVDLVRRDLDYGKFCHDEFYTDEIAGYLKQGKEYEVCIDFVRIMIRRHDNEMALAEQKSEAGPEQGLESTYSSSGEHADSND